MPQLIAAKPDLSQNRASILLLNGSVASGVQKESNMKPKSRSVTFNHRRMVLDMLELALRGTASALLVAALALALIAFAAS